MGYEMTTVPAFPPKHKALTPSNTTVFDYPMNILVMDTGNVAIADEDGLVVTYEAVPAWTVIPVTASKLMATNTTATKFVGIYGEQD